MKKVRDFIPVILSGLISIISIIIYSALTKERSFLIYLQIFVGPIALMVIPILNKFKIVKIPVVLSYLLLIHFFLALILGSTFGFYDRISCWDMILHGYFGFVFAFLTLCILLNFDGEKLNGVLLFILLFFVTMGAAGI